MKYGLAIFAITAMVLVAGCVGQSGEQPAGTTQTGTQTSVGPQTHTVNMVIAHTSYRPNEIIVNRGDTVKIVALTDKDTGTEGGFIHNHGISIDEYAINQVVTSEVNSVNVEFVADKAGTFTIWCKPCLEGPLGAHSGLNGRLVVKE